MAAITYGTAAVGGATRATKSKAGKGFWARFYDRLVEARMRQAHREIRRHLHLLPDYVEYDGTSFTYRPEKLPFVRQD
jgi:hypothetical protein